MKTFGFGCACAALAVLVFGGDSEAARNLALIGALFVLVG